MGNKTQAKSGLILDIEALKQMGLKGEAFWLMEYDIPSAVKNWSNKTISSKFTKEQAKLFRKLRNKTMFELKFKLQAIQNLYSSWFISSENLEKANKLCTWLRQELINAGFPNRANKVRIIPILTNEEGFEAFEERKVEFLLQFATDAQKQVEKGVNDKIMSESVLWRCKKAYEIVDAVKEELKQNKRYNELVDTVAILDDTISQYEAIKEAKKARKAKK